MNKKNVSVIVAGSLSAILSIILVNMFFDHYRLRSPIILQLPIEKRTAVVVTPTPIRKLSPTPTPKKSVSPTPVPVTKVSRFDSVKKYLTDDANKVRNALLVKIEKDYPNIDDQVAMDNIFKQESGYRPDAINEIGACGMGQALPCSKMPCQLSYSNEDVQCQYLWVKQYVTNRYATPSMAWEHHLVNNWY